MTRCTSTEFADCAWEFLRTVLIREEHIIESEDSLIEAIWEWDAEPTPSADPGAILGIVPLG